MHHPTPIASKERKNLMKKNLFLSLIAFAILALAIAPVQAAPAATTTSPVVSLSLRSNTPDSTQFNLNVWSPLSMTPTPNLGIPFPVSAYSNGTAIRIDWEQSSIFAVNYGNNLWIVWGSDTQPFWWNANTHDLNISGNISVMIYDNLQSMAGSITIRDGNKTTWHFTAR